METDKQSPTRLEELKDLKMTYTKTLITSVAIAAFAISPALADGHMEKKKGQHMDGTHAEKTMSEKTMSEKVMSDVKTEVGAEMNQQKLEIETEVKTDVKSKMTAPDLTSPSMTMESDKVIKSEMKSMAVKEVKKPYQGTLRPDASIGTVLQEGSVTTKSSDKDILMYDGEVKMETNVEAMDGDKSLENNTIVVPGGADTLTTVTCPAGTTAQADMTCMITGEFKTQ